MKISEYIFYHLSIQDYEELFDEKLKFEEILNEIEEFENNYSNVNYKDKIIYILSIFIYQT